MNSLPHGIDIESRPAWWNRLRIPTLGGKQFWTDQIHRQEWRIQRNAITGQFRLLNPAGIRFASGSFEDCHKALDRSIRNCNPVDDSEKDVVVTLHGLGRTRYSLRRLCRYLRDQGDYRVVNFSYASTRENILEYATSLARVIQNLDNARSFSFVAHSLGNIVVRRMLYQFESELPTDRFGRMVMLSPPSQGSRLAKKFHDWPLFQLIAGRTGQQLGGDWPQTVARLATPKFQFGIIAGNRNHFLVLPNLLMTRPNDFILNVDETDLEGASEHLILDVNHSTIMNQPRVLQSTLQFLQRGTFEIESE